MNMKKFNEKMGRRHYSKGGYIKQIAGRKYFDDGGIATNPTGAGVGGPGNPTNTNGTGIGGISNALGLNAQSANIQQGTNASQLNNIYNAANNGINAQVGLTNTLTPQAANAVNNQNTIAQQELGVAQGTGPNPALNQLAQTTGQNVNQEAALLAGQRGAGANVGLAGRNIGQQGANTEQQAVGQGATLGAQQEIAEQQNLANLSNQQVGQTEGATTALNTGTQNEQNILQNANTAANNAAVGMQSNINNVNAQNNQGVLGGITSGLSSLTGGLLAKGGEVEPVNPHGKHKLEFVHKMAKLGLENFDSGGSVTPPPPIDKTAAQSVSDSFKSMGQKFADGGQISANPLVAGITNGGSSPMPQSPGYNAVQASAGPNIQATQPLSGPTLAQQASSGFKAGQNWQANHNSSAKANAGMPQAVNTFNNDLSAGPAQDVVAGGLGSDQYAKGGEIWNPEHYQNHFSNYFSGGKAKEVEAMVSPNERYLNPREVEQVKHGADPTKLGRIFPGKDKVKGKDSLKNDIVPTTLEEGGIVIPLHIEKTKDPDKMRLFTLKSLKATGKHMKKPQGIN